MCMAVFGTVTTASVVRVSHELTVITGKQKFKEIASGTSRFGENFGLLAGVF